MLKPFAIGCWAAAAILLSVPTVAAAQEPVPSLSQPAAAVIRDGDVWTVVLTLDRDSPIWGFTHSSRMRDGRPQWRPLQWRVCTPDVTLDRIGERDVLRSRDGAALPRTIRMTITPAPAPVDASYNPALVFGDGSVALYSGQFDLFPIRSEAEAAALPGDLTGIETHADPTLVTWRDVEGPVLLQGRRLSDPTLADAETYVLFGRAGVEEHESLATVVDVRIPEWIRSTIRVYAPSVTDHYTRRLGGGPTLRPTVMASWNGPTSGMTSMGGSVLPGLIAVSFEGEGVLQQTPELQAMVRWFIGHESAHFWLGHTVTYATEGEKWITEGGADLMAIRATKALDPTYDDRGDLQASVDDCVSSVGSGGVESAASRGSSRPFYACGVVFALAAEAARRRHDGGDWFDVLRQMIDAGRADGVLTREEWLTTFEQLADADARAEIEALLHVGAAEPAQAIARLFDRTDVAHRLEAGRVILI
jgi:hypothetical protein